MAAVPDHEPLDIIVGRFETYEDYLDSFISTTDLYYLEDITVARQLVELGYRGNGAIFKREDFLARKKYLEDLEKARDEVFRHKLYAAGQSFPDSPFLQALADREESNLTGQQSTILFVRDVNKQGQEISGYIDYGHRLKDKDMASVFEGKKKLLPKPTDLSFYNWHTKNASANSSTYFKVVTDTHYGLLFQHKIDGAKVNVDPNASAGDSTVRIEFNTSDYLQVVLYDHTIQTRNSLQ